MGHSIKRNDRWPQYIYIYISRRHHSIVIESEEASLCSPIGPDWPWHYFDRLEKAFVRPPPFHTHTHTQEGDQVPSSPSPRVIQWISQLCIYHYDSIHSDGSLSLRMIGGAQTCTNTRRRGKKKSGRGRGWLIRVATWCAMMWDGVESACYHRK